jgi:hypothetical protein
VPRPGPGAPLDLVAVGAARQLQDDLGSRHGGLDPLAGGQVAGHQLDALPAQVAASRAPVSGPAEDADAVAGVPQPRDDLPPRVPVPPVTSMGDAMASS